ncbi:hypothetical protein [Salinarimonas rosea]|uniref:hypothetical protein n=1 Tax=Salinarimonas rosea TaxID=552063 RepID=UPI00048BE958|nr:hypothetical protein [Salinarimonas rosea]
MPFLDWFRSAKPETESADALARRLDEARAERRAAEDRVLELRREREARLLDLDDDAVLAMDDERARLSLALERLDVAVPRLEEAHAAAVGRETAAERRAVREAYADRLETLEHALVEFESALAECREFRERPEHQAHFLPNGDHPPHRTHERAAEALREMITTMRTEGAR